MPYCATNVTLILEHVNCSFVPEIICDEPKASDNRAPLMMPLAQSVFLLPLSPSRIIDFFLPHKHTAHSTKTLFLSDTYTLFCVQSFNMLCAHSHSLSQPLPSFSILQYLFQEAPFHSCFSPLSLPLSLCIAVEVEGLGEVAREMKCMVGR